MYDLLSLRIGKETAENLTTFIEEKIKMEIDNSSQTLATKEDLRREVLWIKDEFKKVYAKIDESKIDLVKWMFAFWVTIIIMIIGLYFKQ